MRKIILLLLLTSIVIQAEKDNNSFNLSKYLKSNEILTLTKPIIISSDNSSFDDISNFTFQENIIYEPSKSYKYPHEYEDYPAAIIIDRSNVTIDFNGFSLIKKISSDPQNNNHKHEFTDDITHGIVIMPGANNVKIISNTSLENKGCITLFSGFAIFFAGKLTESYFINHDMMIQCPLIKNLLIVQNKNGISIQNTVQPVIHHMNISCNHSLKEIHGIYLYNTIDAVINNCTINFNSSTDNVYGILLQDAAGSEIKNSSINFNYSTGFGGVTGINITGSSSETSGYNTIINCNIKNNTCSYTQDIESIGCSINNPSHHNTIKQTNCFGHNHNLLNLNAKIPLILPKSHGIKINNSNNNNIIESKCYYYNTYGFYDSMTISTSSYLNNTARLNKIKNYNIFIPNSLHDGYSTPLPTTVIYQDIISNTNQPTNFFNNIEIR